LAGQGPWNVTWFDGTLVVATHNGVGGTGTSGTDTLSVSPASTKTYTVSALSDANCTAQAGDRTGSAVVTVGTAPTATLTGTAAIRNGQTTTLHAALTGTGPWTVTWSDGHVDSSVGTGSSFTDNYAVSPTSNTAYTVTAVTDSSSLARPVHQAAARL